MPNEKVAYTVEEFLQIWPGGRCATYDAIRRREIPSVKVGPRLYIPRWFVEQMKNGPGAPPEAA